MKYGLRIPSFALGAKTAGLQEMGAYLPLDWSPEQLELIAGEVLPRVETVDGHGPSRSNVGGR